MGPAWLAMMALLGLWAAQTEPPAGAEPEPAASAEATAETAAPLPPPEEEVTAAPPSPAETVTPASPGSVAQEGAVEEIMAAPLPPPEAVTPAMQVSVARQAAGERSQAPYRGSVVALRNVVSALSLKRDSEPTYNPYVVLALRLQPRWWVAEGWYVEGQLDLASELTQADWTNDRFYLSDTYLKAAATDLYTIPWVDVGVSAELALTVPTSPMTLNESLVLGVELTGGLSRSFAVLDGVEVGYGVSLGKSLHRYTTSGDAAVVEGSCSLGIDARCAQRTIGSGERNLSWTVGNGLAASVTATDWLTASAGVQVVYGRLYGISKLSAEQEAELSGAVDDPVSARYFTLAELGVVLFPAELVSGTISVSSLHDQLATDGTYRAPFINRFTRLGVTLSLDVDKTIQLLPSRD